MLARLALVIVATLAGVGAAALHEEDVHAVRDLVASSSVRLDDRAKQTHAMLAHTGDAVQGLHRQVAAIRGLTGEAAPDLVQQPPEGCTEP